MCFHILRFAARSFVSVLFSLASWLLECSDFTNAGLENAESIESVLRRRPAKHCLVFPKQKIEMHETTFPLFLYGRDLGLGSTGGGGGTRLRALLKTGN